MIETALVFDREGRTIYWHLPPGRSSAAIPDDRGLWEVMWENRHRLGGVAHSHPGGGAPVPSHTDLTTFAACEAGLGRRLIWPIVTRDGEAHFMWAGPGRLDYEAAEESGVMLLEVERLRELTGY